MTAKKKTITHSHLHTHPLKQHGHWHDHESGKRDEHEHGHTVNDNFPHRDKEIEPVSVTCADGIEAIVPKYKASKARRPVLTKEWQEKYA